MKKLKSNRWVNIFLIFTLLFSVVGCQSDLATQNPTKEVQGEKPSSSQQEVSSPTDFMVQVFQASLSEEGNTLVSPFSVLCALAMTANGAEGETLAQMEKTLGLSVEELNEALAFYMNQLESSNACQLHMAHSIWVNDDQDFLPNQDFLQTNTKVYQAELFQEVFGNQTTQEINTWVEQQTDGKIKDILDQVPRDAVMYLVNALAFDAEWDEIYQENQIRPGIFTQADGTTQEVDFMYSEEYDYLEDENTTGFIKYYADGQYAFVALLPKENLALEDYVASLTGEQLTQLLNQSQDEWVNAALPKFQSEYELEMSEILQAMGMQDAFDPEKADFSSLGTTASGLNIYLNRVLHKTFIAVDERGTEAGAATVVEMVKEMALMESKTVSLDRPFVYMIMDVDYQIPLFMGTVTNI